MKQKFYLFAVLAAMTATASAQIQTEEGKETKGWPRMLPKELSYDNNVYIVNSSYENSDQPDEKCVLTIYNDDIEKVHSFEIPNFVGYTRYEYYKRKNVPVIRSQNQDSIPWRRNENGVWEESYIFTWEQAQAYAEERFYTGSRIKEYCIYPSDSYYYFQYTEFGESYPRWYYEWNPEDNHLYEITISYDDSYTGDWELIEEHNYNDNAGEVFANLPYYNYDNYGGEYTNTYLTQTLFNTDDKYEYIRRNYEEVVETYNERDDDRDGEIDYKAISYGYQMKSFSIVQEDGTVLQTIPATYTPYLMQINGKRYLFVENSEKNTESDYYVYTYTYYLIDSKSNQIKRMDVEMPMTVRPSVTDRNGQVTVELGEQSDAKEIWVVNGAGQTVKRIPVEKGQKEVVFSANGLNKGVNVVHASGRNAQASRKIVVK